MSGIIETEKIIDLPKIKDPRGNLTFFQSQNLGFEIKRVFWTYDVPGGEERGGHAYKSQFELIVALSGSFDVRVTSANGEERLYHLNRSYYGLLLPPRTWRKMENFSTNAVALHVSSSFYNKEDYIREFKDIKL